MGTTTRRKAMDVLPWWTTAGDRALLGVGAAEDGVS